MEIIPFIVLVAITITPIVVWLFEEFSFRKDYNRQRREQQMEDFDSTATRTDDELE